jgi:hypothetical protein
MDSTHFHTKHAFGSHGQNIDVYLQPFIDELQELWQTGILAWDL